jgi:hypothetical protein
MSWDKRAQELSSVTIGSAIVSTEGAILAKAKSFTATAPEVKEWAGLFKDLPQCRQRGLSYGAKKLFVTQYNESRIIALRDHFVVLLYKTSEVIICAICDQSMPPEAANAACLKMVSELG